MRYTVRTKTGPPMGHVYAYDVIDSQNQNAAVCHCYLKDNAELVCNTLNASEPMAATILEMAKLLIDIDNICNFAPSYRGRIEKARDMAIAARNALTNQ